MKYTLGLWIIIVNAFCVRDSSALFQWIFSSSSSPAHNKELVSGHVPDVAIPFELSKQDEKFLAEAKKLTHNGLDTSPLSDCQQRLVLSLKKDCATLSEEELGKISVNLLNCQSAIEKRVQYPCTNSMSLADCTSSMDSHAWTVYNIMSNRAKATCYMLKQQLFAAKTELLVNRMVHASRDQIRQLEQMEQWQSKLRHLQEDAVSTMQRMTERHSDMVAQQGRLADDQKELEKFVQGNIKSLQMEQELIKEGGEGLVNLTHAVKNKLDLTVSQIMSHEESIRAQQASLASGIEQYNRMNHEMLSELALRTSSLLQKQAEVAEKVDSSLRNIRIVNSSLTSIGEILVRAQGTVNEKISWINGTLTLLGPHQSTLLQYGGHLLLLLVLMMISSFLKFPLISRIFIIITIPLNLYFHLSYLQLIVVIAVICLTDILRYSWALPKSAYSSGYSPRNPDLRLLASKISDFEKRLTDFSMGSVLSLDSKSFVTDDSKDNCDYSTLRNRRLPTGSFSMFETPAVPFPGRSRSLSSTLLGDDESDLVSLAGSDMSSSTLTSPGLRLRCIAQNKNGSQCKKTTTSQARVCAVHRKSSALMIADSPALDNIEESGDN